MKSLVKFLFVLSVLPMLIFTSCKDDSPVNEESEFEILTKYMAQNDLDLGNVLNGWVKPGSAINVNQTDFSVPDYYVIDLRKPEDFAAGHIKDAHNTTLGNILTEAEKAAGKPILVVCYTGQTAARGVGALRLMDMEAYSLKWGMSAWHSDLDGKWAANATDYDSPNWVRSGEPKANQTFNEPILGTYQTDGQSILAARVTKALSNSNWGISKTEVLSNPGNYFVINKWPIDSWNTYGHVNGAYRIDEDLNLENLQKIDPAATSVLYCYTGQTSAITNMWLEVLGFDIRSIMFGANGIVYSELVASDVGGGKKKSWHGEGSGSQLNFGYYDSTGNLHSPTN